MIKILSIELKKILPYRTFWVLNGLYALFFLVFVYSVSSFKINLGGSEQALFKDFFKFPGLWHNFTYVASWFNLLLGILIIILVTNEYTFRTVRQNIIDGLSKADFLNGKTAMVVLLSLCFTLYLLLAGFVFGFIYSGSDGMSSAFSKLGFIVSYFFQTLGYMMFALLIGSLIRKSGLAIGLFLLYIIIIEPVSGYLLGEPLQQFLPMQAVSIIDNPVKQMVPGMEYQSNPFSIQFLLAPVYAGIFYGLSYLLLIKKDL